ncbi:MAG TPA: radical SAM protein [Gemmatimonadales bacterium]|nr:radical SAM protein [Gemmatimonadales bacterium]
MADATPPRGFIVYGPVQSRRLGVSLGLNLLPARSKVCSFDCPYCECGFNTGKAADVRWPSPDEVGHALRRALERLAAVPPDWITFSGSGEPTLHPRFPVVVDRVLAARDDLAPRTRVGVLSNGVLAAAPRIREALLRLDGRFLKLDPGPPERVNGVAGDAGALADSYRALHPVTVQAMVARGPDWDGASAASLAAWVPLLVRAAPVAVQLYSIERPPADPRVQDVPRERLLEMAEAIREALPHAVVEVY